MIDDLHDEIPDSKDMPRTQLMDLIYEKYRHHTRNSKEKGTATTPTLDTKKKKRRSAAADSAADDSAHQTPSAAFMGCCMFFDDM